MCIQISNRLKSVANQVKYRSIADIGTDHAYIPIYLYQTGKIDYALACDINKGPLNRAANNIKNYKCDKHIKILLSDGLQKIDCHVDTIIIAGMGGQLIIDILKNNLKKVNDLKQLVLQPQLDIYKVRKFIHSIGFKIENEDMILEENQFYNIISAVSGNEIYTKEEYYKFGKILIDKKSNILKDYINLKLKNYYLIIRNLDAINNNASNDKKQVLMEEIKISKEVLKWL